MGGQDDAALRVCETTPWIVRATLSHPVDALIEASLDKGEASVIALALECQADVVLIDERKARKVARNVYGLNVVGTAGLLVEAKKKQLVRAVRPLLLQMREQGYWLGDEIVEHATNAAGEKSTD